LAPIDKFLHFSTQSQTLDSSFASKNRPSTSPADYNWLNATTWLFSVALDNAEFNRAFNRKPNRTPFFYLNSSALSEALKERQKLVGCSRRRSLGLGSNRS
jgi:hypothetical protein